jgi:DNA-binding transcriptional ArsR family regulator
MRRADPNTRSLLPMTRTQTDALRAPDVGGSPDDRVFETVAELFGLLSAPIRLKIISAVCQREKNVSELLEEIDTTQPNMSQHLSTLYRSGVLARRREGTQIYYRLQNEFVATVCRSVCTQVAISQDTVPPIGAVAEATAPR